MSDTDRTVAARFETVIRPPVFAPAALLGKVRMLRGHRDLIQTLALHRIKVRYKQSLLGLAWAALQPLATMAVLTVVFTYIAPVATGGEPYGLIVLAGLVPWTCFSNAVTTGTGSLVSNAQLVIRIYFPREILPLTYVVTAVIDCAVAALVLTGLIFWYGSPAAPNLALLIISLLVLLLLSTAFALLLSATQVYLRDVGVAIPIVLQLLFFASPVAYPLAIVPERIRDLYALNPLVGIIENFRRAVLHTGPPDPASLTISAAWALALLPTAYAWFKHLEATAADVV